jgi:hypothetical protein
MDKKKKDPTIEAYPKLKNDFLIAEEEGAKKDIGLINF